MEEGVGRTVQYQVDAMKTTSDVRWRTVAEVSRSLQLFSWVDYAIFFTMLMMCAFIGVYFGVIDKRNNKSSSVDYLMGGRSMAAFPITLSLIASYISGITLLGFPTEIYIYGIQYSYSIGGLILMAVLMCYCYLPTLHNLKLMSSYEYLAMRFDNRVRLFGSILFCIGIMNWLPLVIYVPALAFNQVTGVNVHVITPFVSLVCIFYTTLGGLKAVVWTDVLQTFSMFGAIILVCVKGTLDVGGVGEVFRRNLLTGRIEMPDLRLDPTVRHTVWGLLIGGSLYYLQSNAINQTMIQRYLALPDLNKAKTAVWGFTLGTLLLTAFCTYSGMLIFAIYHNCDPLSTKLAKAKDQLLPLLVMETLGEFPGLPGLFVAGVFSAALSSMSTGLNSMSAVILEDFYKTFVNKEPSDRVTNIVMRSTVIVTGIICVALVYVVEQLGQVLQLAMSLSAITTGPSMGVFTMGLFFPWINATGALWGGIVGLVTMVWLVIGTQNALANGLLRYQPKPLTTAGCGYVFNHTEPSLGGSVLSQVPFGGIVESLVIVDQVFNTSTTAAITMTMTSNVSSTMTPSSTLLHDNAVEEEEVFILFRLSYMWYTLVGMFVSIIAGFVVTYITKTKRERHHTEKMHKHDEGKDVWKSECKYVDNEETATVAYGVDINLLSPVVQWFYRKDTTPLTFIGNKLYSLKVDNADLKKTTSL